MDTVHFLGDVFGDRLQLSAILDQLNIETDVVFYPQMFEHGRPNLFRAAILTNPLFNERNPGQH